MCVCVCVSVCVCVKVSGMGPYMALLSPESEVALCFNTGTQLDLLDCSARVDTAGFPSLAGRTDLRPASAPSIAFSSPPPAPHTVDEPGRSQTGTQGD